MKLGIISSVFVAAAAAAAIAVAPSAVAANPTTTTTDGAGTTTTIKREGHTQITVTPPDVSDARSYGEFTSPAPIIG